MLWVKPPDLYSDPVPCLHSEQLVVFALCAEGGWGASLIISGLFAKGIFTFDCVLAVAQGGECACS